MALANYADLKASIAGWIARNDLTSIIPDFIVLGESWLSRPPQPPDAPEIGGLRGSITRTTGTLTAGSATLAYPSGFGSVQSLELTADGRDLDYLTASDFALRKRTGTGEPRYYTLADTFVFDITCDSAYAYELAYFGIITALSDSNTTNWALTNYPGVYLAACMFHASRYIKDEQGAQGWLQQYKVDCAGANEQFRAKTQSSGTLQIRTDTGNP